LRPRLAEALVKKGKTILFDDQRGDNISARVEEFRHAGQMFARARTLQPDLPELAILEKLSAAQALIALQFYDEAEKALGQIPRSAVTENSLGIVFNGKLEYWKAERAFKNAIEMDPAAAMPHYNLGMLLRLQKNETALAEFEAAARLESRNYAVFLALGDEYFSRSSWQAAADAYRKAVALRSWDDTLHTKLGHALYSQGLRDEANKAYQRAKELRSRQ
jgi:tetratricopeptide (TPR) repeat protein